MRFCASCCQGMISEPGLAWAHAQTAALFFPCHCRTWSSSTMPLMTRWPQALPPGVCRDKPEALTPALQPGLSGGMRLLGAHAAVATAALCCLLCRSEFLKTLTHVRLDRLHIRALKPEALQRMPSITHVYLQHNCITSMAPLALLPQLRFCTLSHNDIEQVRMGLTPDLVGHTECPQHSSQACQYPCWSKPA